MNKTITLFRRVGAMLLCLSMLCGVIMSSIVMPTMAAPDNTVKTFDVNFADLAALVEDSKYDANGLYASTETDTAINEWVNARFGIFVNRENSRYAEKQFLGQGSFSVPGFEVVNGSAFNDNWGGEINLKILESGALHHTSTKVGDQQIRKSHALTVKNQYGDYAELANFEAEVVFNKANTNPLGALYVSFHESTPGKMVRHNSTFLGLAGNEAVIVGSVLSGSSVTADGIIVGNIANTNTKTGYTSFGAKLDNNADYKLTVRVVGTALTATVTKVADGSVVHTSTKTIAAGSGSLSVGLANSARNLKSVKVTELDENGNPVDFGQKRTMQDFSWTLANKTWYGSGKYGTSSTSLSGANYYNFADQTTASAKAIIAALNKQFDNVYNREGTVKDSTFGKKVSYEGQTNNYAWYRTAYLNRWLQFTADGVGGRERMRHISSLVPKGHDGERFYFQNFETTFTARLNVVGGQNISSDGAVIVFGFRQKTAGQFTSAWYGMSQEQGMVAIQTKGYNFAGGTQIIGARTNAANAADDMYNKMQNAFSTAIASNSVVTVTVRAVGDQVYLKIQDDGTTIVEQTKTIPYVEPGYISYGIGNYGSDIGEITLTHLDENGNKISLYEQTQTEKDARNSATATHREIDFKDIPGAEYVSGKYTAAKQNYAYFGQFAPSVFEEVQNDVQLVYNDGTTHTTRSYGSASYGEWLLFYNRWLQLSSSPKDAPTRMGRFNALVPLDENGIRHKLADSQVKFDFNIENNETTMVVGLRQNLPGLFMTGENTLNQNQVLIAITKKSIRVAGGDDIRFEDFALGYDLVDEDNDPETPETKVWREYADDAFGDVFAAPLQTNGGTAVSVEARALGNTVTVTIRSNAGTQLYTGTFTTNYVESGYTAIGVSNTGKGNVGAITLSKVTPAGYYTDYPKADVLSETFADGKKRLVADFLVQANKPISYTDGVYVPTANDSSINLWFAENFALRYNREDVAADRMYLGQSSTEIDANGKNTYWAFTESGTLLRKADADGKDMLEQYDSLVPKAPNGLTATMQNFQAEYTVYDTDANEGAVVLSFRGSDRGVVANGEKSVYAEQSMVVIGTDKNGDIGVSVVDGNNAGDAYTTVATKVPALVGVDAYKVTVKAVGTTVNVLITSLDGTTTYYSNASTPATINNIGNGYIALGVTNTTKAFGSFVLTELDESGNVVDFGTNTRSAGDKFYFSVTDLVELENATYLKADGTTGTKANVYKATRWDAEGNPITYGGEYVDVIGEDGNPIRTEDGKLPTGEQVGDPTKYAQFQGTEYYTFADKVGENAHPDASTIINYLDNKFAIYYNNEGSYYQMEAGLSKAYASQTANFGYFGNVYANRWLERTVSGVGGSQTFRLITSVVPRNAVTGEELRFKNFETSFDVRFSDGITAAKRDQNSVIIGFRQRVPGKFTGGYYKLVQEQAFVAISPTGLTIAAGDDIYAQYDNINGSHRPAEGDMYNADQTAKFDAVLPQTVNVTVRVVGNKVTVTIKSGSTIYYDNSTNPAVIDYDTEGYLAIGMGSGKVSLADVSIARLDNIGEQTDVNNTDAVPGCEWDTTADRFSETMNKSEAEISALYDFYYHGGNNYVAKEALTAHWAVDADGVLVRANDLGDSATDNLATLALKKDATTLDTFKNFDAVFKVKLDDKKQSTFWVIGRQKDAATVGQVVKTTGGTDYHTDRFAVGVSAGGKVTVSIGDGTSAEIAGRTAGTPAGVYNVRVRAYGRVIEVYLNGTLRVTRTLPATITDAGYLSFGFAGKEGGIASLYLTRLNDYGAAVDYSTEYTQVETFEPQMIGTNEGIDALNLPTTVKVWKNGVEEISKVYWDPNSVDFSVDGDVNLVGYLEVTNGIRAVLPVQIGKYNRNNTVMYNFDSAIELEDFESWYLPTTNGTDLPLIHTEGTADDNFVVKNGVLGFQHNSMYASNTAIGEGVTINGFTYQNADSNAGYASNHGVAVLKTQKYKNFILDVDIKANGKWAPLGFGASDYTDPLGIHASSTKGGYSFHIEHGIDAAKLWGYTTTKGKSATISSAKVSPSITTGYHHYQLVVSDGVAMLYFDYADAPVISYELPETYKGGYIYLSMNDKAAEYDNLKIVDLDKEEIVVTELVTELENITIHRELGESLAALPKTVMVADAAGHEYTIIAPWNSDDYRSWKEGTSTFTLDPAKAWHGFDLTALQDASLAVTNIIGNDYDQKTSRKYYFDHENDLLDFQMQYSKHGYEYKGKYYDDYHSMYSGILVSNDKAFTIRDGKATNTASATGMGSGWTTLQSMRGVATAVLKDVNLYNFTLEFDYTHSGMWYTYGLIGVQNPNSAHMQANWSETNRDFIDENPDGTKKWKVNDIGKIWRDGLGGGVWIHNEQEGNVNLNGDMGGHTARHTKTNDDKVYDGTKERVVYDNGKQHHISITVVDGLITVQMDYDENRIYYASVNETSLGGLLGFGNQQNGSTIDNFQVTALDHSGEPIAWDDLVAGNHTGWAPEPIPDNYLGWKPKDDFVWGDEYED